MESGVIWLKYSQNDLVYIRLSITSITTPSSSLPLPMTYSLPLSRLFKPTQGTTQTMSR